MKNTVVSETVAAIQAATGFDDRHTPDVAAAVGRAFDAGAKTATTVAEVPPLTADEIAAWRGNVRAQLPAKGKAKK